MIEPLSNVAALYADYLTEMKQNRVSGMTRDEFTRARIGDGVALADFPGEYWEPRTINTENHRWMAGASEPRDRSAASAPELASQDLKELYS